VRRPLNALRGYLEIVERPQEEWNLFEVWSQVSRIAEPGTDFRLHRMELQRIEQQVKVELAPDSGIYDVISVLNSVLFEELGFQGNREDYYNPKNSYVASVLQNRKGIPISLSILYRELAGRVGLKLLPVAMPGHFLLKCVMPLRELFIDPFNRGEILLEEGCRERLAEIYQQPIEFRPEFLRAVSKKEVVLRILMNLKLIYRQQGNASLLLAVLERRMPLLGDPLPEILERGFIKLHLEDYRGALQDLEFFAENSSDAEVKTVVEKRLDALRLLARGN
jgi:regulator of sirC expression with transglutaminase-like and TPR domain